METELFKSNQNLRDAFPEYSFCKKCGKPWNTVKSKSVLYNKNIGTFATCVDCWNNSTLEELKGYFAVVYHEQAFESFERGLKMNHTLEHLLSCVENEFYPVKTSIEKAPIGIEPKNIWISQRVKDLREAIIRYLDEYNQVPTEWLNEYNEHLLNRK